MNLFEAINHGAADLLDTAIGVLIFDQSPKAARGRRDEARLAEAERIEALRNEAAVAREREQEAAAEEEKKRRKAQARRQREVEWTAAKPGPAVEVSTFDTLTWQGSGMNHGVCQRPSNIPQKYPSNGDHCARCGGRLLQGLKSRILPCECGGLL